jgi:nitroreductase
MNLDELIRNRNSCRFYDSKIVKKEVIFKLIKAAQLAPSACNLQLTHYLIVDNQSILQKLSKHVNHKFSWAPVYIFLLYDSQITNDTNSTIVSLGMSAQNILLKAQDLGLSTCPITGFNNHSFIKKELFIPKNFRIALSIALGYSKASEEEKNIKNRMNLKDVISINKCSSLNTLTNKKSFRSINISEILNYRKRISSVYLEQFKLNTWSSDYYNLVYDFFKKNVIKNFSNNSNILDVITYDALFFKKLYKDHNLNFNLLNSDYLKKNLAFYSKKFPEAKNIIINNRNDFEYIEDKSIDLSTFIFQAEFTPNLSYLLENTYFKLGDQGILFISTVKQFWYKKIIKIILNLIKKRTIYDNNPAYKIGFYNNNLNLRNIIKKTKFHIKYYKILKKDYKRGNKLIVYLLYKNKE